MQFKFLTPNTAQPYPTSSLMYHNVFAQPTEKKTPISISSHYLSSLLPGEPNNSFAVIFHDSRGHFTKKAALAPSGETKTEPKPLTQPAPPKGNLNYFKIAPIGNCNETSPRARSLQTDLIDMIDPVPRVLLPPRLRKARGQCFIIFIVRPRTFQIIL